MHKVQGNYSSVHVGTVKIYVAAVVAAVVVRVDLLDFCELYM
jgi:hypothetical protein